MMVISNQQQINRLLWSAEHLGDLSEGREVVETKVRAAFAEHKIPMVLHIRTVGMEGDTQQEICLAWGLEDAKSLIDFALEVSRKVGFFQLEKVAVETLLRKLPAIQRRW